jgi:hypothetical protein
VLGWKLGMVGVTAAVAAFIAGRLAGNLYLIRPCIRMLGDASATPSSPHPFGSDGPPRSDVA